MHDIIIIKCFSMHLKWVIECLVPFPAERPKGAVSLLRLHGYLQVDDNN